MILVGTGGAILLALAALLVLAGVVAFVEVLTRLDLDIPVVNWNIGKAIGGAIEGAVSRAARWLWGGIGPAMEFLAAPIVAVVLLVRQAAHAIEELVGAVERALHAATRALHQAEAYAAHLGAEIVAGVQWTEHHLDLYVQAVQRQLVLGIDSVAERIVAGVQSTEHRIDLYVAATGAQAATDLDHVATEIVAGVQSTEHRIDLYVAATGAQALEAVSATRVWATEAIDTLRGDVDTGLEAARGYTEDAVSAAEGIIAGYLATQVVPTLAKTATEVDECLEPNCDSLRTLGKGLHGLSTLFLLGLIAAFVAAAVEDPTGVADDILTVGGPLEDIVLAAARGAAHL